jgi:hypothetical protein
MALKYYPLSRVSTNKYTRGNQFVLPNGNPYTGKYYETYNNKFFTGITPALGTNEELIPISVFNARNRSSATLTNTVNNITVVPSSSTAYDQSTGQLAGNLVELNPYTPIPVPSDYQRGYFTRYFAKKVSGPGFIIEISQQDWSQVSNGNVDRSLLSYEITDMLWQLTGPLNDTRISQYQIQGGVFTTNKRVTEFKQKSFRGIIEYIGGDYTKFAKITGPSVATSGSM